MTVLTRAQAQAQADLIRAAAGIHVLTPEIVGAYLRSIADTVVFPGEAQTPPTAGNGLTGTNVFSVLPDGATIGVSSAGVKIPDQAGNSVLGRAASSSGAVAPIAGTDGQAFRVSGATLGFGTLATAAYADASVTTVKIADANVTLAKMANIATDSLIGRDTAGSGVPENITLNSTLSMTGAGALQRAALTGDVTAAAGSNTTAFGSGAFGALNLSTTGFVSIGSGTVAASGNIRSNNAFTIYGRNSFGGLDTPIFVWDGTIPKLTLGSGNTGGLTAFIEITTNALLLRVGTNVQMSVLSGAIQFNTNKVGWAASVVTAPLLTQDDSTAGAGTGQKMTIRAQSCIGATSTGGALDIGPGAGTTTGGLARLVSGSAAARLSWSDTGVGHFGTTPAAQPADVGALTTSVGVYNATIPDVGATFNQTTLNGIVKTLSDQINSLRAASRTIGNMA